MKPNALRFPEAEEAADVLRGILADGPCLDREVRALAAAAGVYDTLTLRKVIHRLGLVWRMDVHRRLWWALPDYGIADELAADLATNEGKFAAFLVERDRLANPDENVRAAKAIAPGEQGELF